MQENDMGTAFKLCVLAEAIKLTKDAYLKTKDRRIAAAALVLTELALSEAEEMEWSRREAKDE